MPVNSRKSCCLPSNLKEGDFSCMMYTA
jgi:hypothetical protein